MKKFLIMLLCLVLLGSTAFAFGRPKIALVLSGGGSRGIPEVAIIKELDRRGIYPDMILGTSMGGLIGGLYAVGYTPEEMENILRDGKLQQRIINMFSANAKVNDKAFTNTSNNLFSLGFDIESPNVGKANGFFDDQYVNAYIRTLLLKVMEGRDFDTLSIPYRSIGTNLQTSEKVVFSSGSLFDAMRGSMSIPIVFPPLITEDGKYIVDGGVVDNLPVKEAEKMGADIIIAVDVNESVAASAETDEDLLNTLSGVIIQYSVISTQFVVKPVLDKVDYLFVPDTTKLGIFDFTKVDEYLAVGQKCVDDNIAFFDELEEKLAPYLPMKEPIRYSQLPYYKIKEVVFPEYLENYEKEFKNFAGKVANEKTIEEFELLLDVIRLQENLKSINYRVKNGQYIIEGTQYDSLKDSASIGLSGDLGLLTNAFYDAYFKVYFNQTARISADLVFKKVSLGLDLEYGQYLSLLTSLKVPFAEHTYFNNLTLGYGYIPPFGYRKLNNQFKNSNYLVQYDTGLTFFIKQVRFDLYGQAGYLNLGNDVSLIGNSQVIWENRNLFWALACFDLNANNFAYTLSSKLLYSQQLSLSIGYSFSEQFVYSAKYEGLFAIPIVVRKNFLFLATQLATLKLPRALTSSFVPDYFSSLATDRFAFELGYKQYIFDSRKFFYSVSIMFEMTSPLYKGNGIPEKFSLVPFDNISNFNYAIEGRMGTKITDATLSLFARIGVFGDLAIGLEVK